MDKSGLRFPPGLKEDGPGGYVERENMTQHSIPIPQVSAIILTFNEERHIVRCIRNIGRIAREIFVVDSFSSDRTCELAEAEGAHVVQHPYINQAQQFQWALENLPCSGEWVMRMDADEYLTDGLIAEIRRKLPDMPQDVTGCYLPRDVIFLGKNMRHGRIAPPKILRLWRRGMAYMEQRWMDERCVVKSGRTIVLNQRFVDHNLNGLSWWTDKHNNYSNRELAVEVGGRCGLFPGAGGNGLAGRDRKKSRYYRLPPFLRAFGYFFMRYVCLGGFLDGCPGLIWAVLQAFWYRFLIDAKMYELELNLGRKPSAGELKQYMRSDLNLKVN